MKNYFTNRDKSWIYLKKEMVVYLIVEIWVVTRSILRLLPLNYVLDFNKYVQASWIVSKEYEPPFGHAELLGLKVFVANSIYQ